MNKAQEIMKKDTAQMEKSRELYQVTPAVDIYENTEEILVHADMPGVAKKDVTVDIDNGKLSISATRSLKIEGRAAYEEFSDVQYVRHFSVPQTIDVGKVEAELKDGVLRLHLPKSEAAKPRQIEIKTA